MNIELPQAPSDVLEATLDRTGHDLSLGLVGAADLRVEAYFESVLKRVHEQCLAAEIRKVEVDLRKLTFINSACLKSFVVWISDVRELKDKGYRIVFLQDSSVSWQKRSLKSLKAFGPEVVELV